jgi:hypothetical protein
MNGSYCSADVRVIKFRRMRVAEHVARMGQRRLTYRVLVGMSEGKRPLGRPRCRREDNIKPYVEGRYEGVDWIDLVHDIQNLLALVKTVMNLRVPQIAGNSLTSRETVSFKRMNLLHCMSDQFVYPHIHSFNFSVSCSAAVSYSGHV